MKTIILCLALLLTVPVRADAEENLSSQASHPVVIESYYRVKWGSEDEFKELYRRNELALLLEMQREGFVRSVRFEEPFTHIPGDARWTFRATITYRDGPSAVEVGGSWDRAWEEARKRLRPDKKQFDAEQARRFGLLEDHWDVIVTQSEFDK
jgi:hypothetical protein